MTPDAIRSGEMTVPVSIGEVVDKITILEIKSERLPDPERLSNVREELSQLSSAFEAQFPDTSPALDELIAALKGVNSTLWEIEDAIRECERARSFGDRFVELARAVYKTNDRRAALKREINVLLGSQLIEEKSYSAY
jgi:chaperonin cofactor prefoldin